MEKACPNNFNYRIFYPLKICKITFILSVYYIKTLAFFNTLQLVVVTVQCFIFREET